MNGKFERQARLVEIGRNGQTRLQAADATLGDAGLEDLSLQTWIAREYLERAGLRAVAVSGPEDYVAVDSRVVTRHSLTFPHDISFEHDVARELGRGAWRALRMLRDALALPRENDPSATAKAGM